MSPTCRRGSAGSRPCLGPVATYNVATGDYITVGEIAEMAIEAMGLDPEHTEFEFSGSDRGWKGDVPVVRLNTERIRAPRLDQRHVDSSGHAGLVGVDAGGSSLRESSHDGSPSRPAGQQCSSIVTGSSTGP